MYANSESGRIISLIKVAAGIAVFGLVAGQASAGTIVGTDHDFSGSGFSGGQLCVVCHTPHNADTSVSTAPLWNHEQTVTVFTMYTSPSMDAASDGEPTGTSKLCLSCHDGTVAIDSFGGNTGTVFMSGNGVVGLDGDLADDHPISITFDTALSVTDPGLHDPSATTVTIGEGGDKTRIGFLSEVMLSADKVQCSSCHDVHNNFVAAGTGGEPFLKITANGSELCLACHNK